MSVSRYIVNRVLQLLPVLFVVGTTIFFMFRIVPGDPAQAILGRNTTPQALASLRHEMGLDKPVLVQYVAWFQGVARGNLGLSRIQAEAPVNQILEARLANTLELIVFGVALSLVVGIPLGIAAATHRGWLDQGLRVGAVLGFSVPSYWLAVLFLLFFAAELRWFPAGGFVSVRENPSSHLRHLVLPVVTIGLIQAAGIVRYLRAGMLEVLNLGYIKTAKAKGLTGHAVVYKHALKNALIPIITVLGVDIGRLVSGLVVIEQIYTWPGLGWQLITSIMDRDYEVVQGAILFSALLFVSINILVDVLYALLDPRIRYQ